MKKRLHFFMFLSVFFSLGLSISAYGQLLLEENFDYAAGTPILDNTWLIQQTNTTNPIMIAGEGLTYPGYIGSGIGNAVKMADTGQDVFKGLPEKLSTGSIYLSLMVNVDSASAGGEYFVSFKESATSATNTNYRGRLYAKADENMKLAFGISKGGNVVDYTGFDYDLHKTYLVVMKYTFNATDFDAANSATWDEVSLYVNPVIGGQEPAAIVTSKDDKSEMGLGSVLLRQGDAGLGARLTLDGIRIGQTWLDAVGELVVVEKLLLEDNFDYPAESPILDNNWTIQQTNVNHPVMVSNMGLVYPGYIGSGIGNAVNIGDTGQDVFRGFDEKISSGDIYMTFMVSVDSATVEGDYFFSLKESATSETNTNFRSRFYVKSDQNKNLAFGISKGANVIDYTGFDYALHTTYLVVVKYSFNPLDFDAANSATWDHVSLFVNPEIGGSEPAPLLTSTDDKSEMGLGSVLLRQGSDGKAGFVVVDGIRVGQSWTFTLGELQKLPILAYDEFNYPAGELLSAQAAGNWAALNTTGNTEPVIAVGSLNYPMLEPALANKVSFDGGGTDLAKTFESQSVAGTTVYFSFIFQVTSMEGITSTDGTHFAGFATATSTYGCGVYLKWDGVEGSNKFYIGHAARSTSSATVVYTETAYNINEPILVVGSYEIVEGELNDVTQLWVNPASNYFGVETAPAPLLTSTTAGGSSSDISPVNKFYIRQDAATSTPFIELDELRIAKSWGEVTPKASQITFNPANNSQDVDKTVNPAIIYVSSIRKIGGGVIENSDLATLVLLKKENSSGANVPFTATIDDSKQIITVTPDQNLELSTSYYIAVNAVENEAGDQVAGGEATFKTRMATSNAGLSDLAVNGVTVEGFASDVLEYNIEFDYGTTVLPTVTWMLNDENASAALGNISSYPGTANLVVTAEDGTTTSTYKINFTVSTVKSSDATLKDLMVNGVSIPGFRSDLYEYEVVLPFEITDAPVISAVTNSAVATVEYFQPSSTTAMGGVVVKAQDGTTEAQYVVFFSVSPYIYAIGWNSKNNDVYPHAGWTTENTIISNNFGTEPIVDHNEFEGPFAFRFICGKAASGSASGWLSTAKYKYSATLRFWLYVQLPDGNEMLSIEKKVGDADPVLVATLTAADMQSNDWKEFTYEINEQDSTAIIFTSSLTTDGATRIWIDDLSLTGKKINTAVNDLEIADNQVLLYPNPVKNQLNFTVKAGSVKAISLYNITGQKVFDSVASYSNYGVVEVGHLKEGIYFIKMETDRGAITRKFIKE